uniref:Uncharacterized protein n=1 Tax=Glossina austeni TaxID=7395 RepID=A0A1A9V088_GLOAU
MYHPSPSLDIPSKQNHHTNHGYVPSVNKLEGTGRKDDREKYYIYRFGEESTWPAIAGCRIRKHVNVCNEKDRIGENKKRNSEVVRVRKLANNSLPSTDRKNEANQLSTMIRIQ